ncbi:MAG: LicD family protein [Prevotellaceae bacterium]|jgi:hypothetical protein|nr:LicD family protein [Prevotellaceae bacterium]
MEITVENLIKKGKYIIKNNITLKKTIYPVMFKLSKKLNYRQILIKKYGLDVLKLVDKIANEHNIPYYVDYGTLLGFIRDGNFIKYDDDIDFSILPTQNSILAFAKGLLNNGFAFDLAHLADNNRFIEFRVRYREISIDFFLPSIKDGFIRQLYCQCELKYPLKPLIRYSITNFEVNILENPEEHLEWRYGETWKTPIQKFDDWKQKPKGFLGEKYYEQEEITDYNIFCSLIDKYNKIQ